MARRIRVGGNATPGGLRRFFTTIPRAPSTFGIPQAGSLRRAEAASETTIPQVEIPLPEEHEQQLIARWQAWQDAVVGPAGSLPEYIVWEWLVQKKRLTPHIDFIYQYNILGGRTMFGGFVVDFYFPQLDMAWNVQGLHFHYVKAEDRARDQAAKLVLSNRELLVIELFEDDLMTRPEFVLEAAWNGSQASRGAL